MSRMRPHTRTQCQDGNQCPECKETPLLQNNSSNNSSTNLQNNITPISGTNNAGAAGGGGSSAGCHSGTTRATGSIASSSSGSSGYSTSSSTSTGSSNSDPFIAPTGTVSRRSSTCGFLTSHHGKSRLSLQGGLTLGAAAASNGDATRAMLIVELPAEILFKILSYMSFKEISYLRMVSRRFNEICASMLNSTFQRLQSQMLSRFQEIKTQMPRRESARRYHFTEPHRNHPLAQECDVVETLHMRLSLLQMTLGKHIERKHVCFFAGEILDEVLRIIRYIQKAPTGQPRNPKNPYIYMEDELFDLSTMAMEYFKEHIEPTLPEITYFGADFLDFTSFSSTSPTKRRSASGCGSASILGGNCLDSPCSSRASVAGSSVSEAWSSASTVASADADSAIYMEAGPSKQPPQSNMVLRKRIRRIRQGMKRYNDQLVDYKKELKTCKTKMETQSKQVHEYSERFEQYDKKFAESSNKFQTLLTELNKCKIELQYWRSKSTTLLALPSTINPTCASCSAPLLPEGGLQSAENAEAELKNLANKGIFLTEDLTPTSGSDSDPPPPTEAESPPPLNSSDKDISGSLDVQKQPQQLQQPYLIEDFIPTVFVEQESKSPSLVTKPQTCKSGPPSPVSAVGRKRRSRDDDLLAGDLNDLESKRKSSLRGGSTGAGSGGGSTVGGSSGSTSGSSGGSAVKNTRFKRPKMSSTAS